MATVKLHRSWQALLGEEFSQPYFRALADFVNAEYATRTVYPPRDLMFSAFNLCPADQVKVVILGQDPYHGPGQAHGLSFSVPEGVTCPPSLVNIFKALNNDLGTPIPNSGNLIRWAEQGVLLLNTSLTVRQGEPNSHQHSGWHLFTDAVIRTLSAQRSGIAYLLWGSHAQSKAPLINPQANLILRAVHPSPLSAHRGFLTCGHFSQANLYLQSQGKTPIVW